LNEVFSEEFGEKNHYFFDEVQNATGWELFVRSLLDGKKHVVLTGSNASLLSRELGTRLTGRHLSYELFPFSYAEFLKLAGKKQGENSFRDYLQKGGFPEYLKNGKPEILQHLLNDILARDVSIRHKIRSLKTVKEMALFLLSNVGKEFTYNSLKKTFGLGSTNTAVSFVSFFEDAYLLFTVPKFDYSLKKQLVNPKKAYSIDNGLTSVNSASLSQDEGRLLENAVFLQLRRKHKDVYYFKKTGECDFVVREGRKVTSVVQACVEVTEENRKRELSGLVEAMRAFNLDTGTIVTLAQEDVVNEGGKKIFLKPAWKWFLTQTR